MQFAVPQFTDVEDKLIGPLTLKQFLILLAAGGVVMFFWSLFGLSFFFFIFALPVVLLGIAFAFGKFNGRPLFSYAGSLISFFSRPQARVFKREEPTVVMHLESKSEKVKSKTAPPEITEGTESRLKRLAYLLDQKAAEERELTERK
jgi:hypothetical protein